MTTSPKESGWARVEIVQGDITTLAVDAIVNAANSSLRSGGGVDGAIHRAAGPGLLAECAALGGCPTGEARITHGYNLPAKWVIHTVGPIYFDGSRGEADDLRACYVNSLDLAAIHGITSIAFPAISCGAYGFPLESAARIAISTTIELITQYRTIQRVIFILFGAAELQMYERIARKLRGDSAPT